MDRPLGMAQIRRVSPDDIELFRNSMLVFGEAFREMDTYTKKIPSEEYIRALLQKDSFIALVALEDGKVVGALAAYVLEKFEQERKEIYIYDIAVSEAYRRRGIATALIKRLKDIAKEVEAYVIYVQADRGDEAAIRLYESFGKKEEVLHFDIDVY